MEIHTETALLEKAVVLFYLKTASSILQKQNELTAENYSWIS